MYLIDNIKGRDWLGSCRSRRLPSMQDYTTRVYLEDKHISEIVASIGSPNDSCGNGLPR
jgi:hypothetical protein